MRRLVSSAMLAAAVMSGAASASAQASPDAAAALWNQARGHYAAAAYTQALPLAVQAAQADPDNAEYYLGIARILFWLERYDDAVFYYDIYLNHFGPSLTGNIPARNRVDRVREERNSANEGRTDPTAVVAAPAAQTSTRDALIAWIDRGTVLTSSGGGAWSQWENLLRAGYAAPDLPELRARLAAALLDEAELLVNGRVARMPSLSYEQWQVQKRRFEAWRSLGVAAPGAPATATPGAALDPTVAASLRAEARAVNNADAQLALCDGQLEYLNLNHDRAGERFAAAIAADPDLLPAHMGLLNSLFQQRETGAAWDSAVEAFAAAVSRVDPDGITTVNIYRAAAATDRGDYDFAVSVLAEALGL